jgi:VanZ family protein
MAALFAASSIPDHHETGPRILFVPPTIHNLLHVPAYALLAALWWRARRAAGAAPTAALITAVLVTVLYGVLDEIHQYFVPGRMLSLTDALLNAVGALLTALVVRLRSWPR